MSADPTWTHIEYREPDWKLLAGALAAGLAAAIAKMDSDGVSVPGAAARAFRTWEQFTILPSAHPATPGGESR